MSSYKEVDSNGDINWYKEGTRILHREDGPAVECLDGHKAWVRNNHLHREDGPAVIYAPGKFYREEWFIDGKFHREDGPAVTHHDGVKHWWYNGKRIYCSSQKEFLRLIKLKAFW